MTDHLDTLLRRDLLDAVALSGSARPPVLDGGDVAYVVDDTAVGPLLLATRSDGVLLASSFAPSDVEADATLDRLARTVSARILRRSTPALDDVRRQLADYLAGRRAAFDVPVDLSRMTAFQQEVLQAACQIPRGQVRTYSDLARQIGRPKAARAVGQALGSNPVPIVVPCHRVLAADGSLRGYSGGGGLATKEQLLRLEGARG